MRDHEAGRQGLRREVKGQGVDGQKVRSRLRSEGSGAEEPEGESYQEMKAEATRMRK